MARHRSTRAPRGRSTALVLAVAALWAGAVQPAASSRPTSLHGDGEPSRPALQAPDIVFMLTDDQRWDSLIPDEEGHRVMPEVQALLADKGTTLNQYFLSVALCCPSRASIMRGQYAHTTGVYGNAGQYGGYPAFHGPVTTSRPSPHGSTTAGTAPPSSESS